MYYQIVDNGASIRFVGDMGEQLILKNSIQRIGVVMDVMIEIYTGEPLTTIYIDYRDVYDPQTLSPVALRDFINGLFKS